MYHGLPLVVLQDVMLHLQIAFKPIANGINVYMEDTLIFQSNMRMRREETEKTNCVMK